MCSRLPHPVGGMRALLVLLLTPAAIGSMAVMMPGADSRHPPETRQRVYKQFDAWKDAWDNAQNEKARVLAERGDVRSLLMAVALARSSSFNVNVDSPSWANVGSWLDAARIAAPDEPLVDWMALLLCEPELREICSIETASQALKRREPDNAAIPLALLKWEQKDDAGRLRLRLHEAAKAARYDSPVKEIAALIKEAIALVEPPGMVPELREAMEASAWPASSQGIQYNRAMTLLFYSWPMPAMAYVKPCRLAIEKTPEELRDDCRRVMTLLADDDASLLTSLFGTMGMVRLTAEDVDGPAWRERLRQRFWLMEQGAWHERAGTGLPDDLFFIIEREPAVLRERLHSRGISLSPPEGWLPADPRRRDLVTTGHAEAAAAWMRQPVP